MRVTTNMILQEQTMGLRLNTEALDRAQARVTTGLKLQTASDDPTAASSVMATSSSLRALDQYKTNVSRASARINAEDSTLQQVSDLVTRAKELGIAQVAGTATDQTRATAKAELQQIFSQIVSLGNTKVGNEYIFGGDKSTTAPYGVTGSGATIDYTTTSPAGARVLDLGQNPSQTISHTGTQVFEDTGVLGAVRDMTRAMDPASSTYGTQGITDAMTKIDTAFDGVQTYVGEVGARAQALQVTSQNLDAYKTNLTTFKSDLEDVDIETAVTELTSRQTAYQAAMLATSKVLGLSLTDYLR